MPIINFRKERGMIEPTEQQKRERKRQIRIEKIRQKMTLFRARLLNERISPNDTRTLQAHKDGSGALRQYYIENGYLRGSASYGSVIPILEDEENGRYVYRGIVLGANNATGVIESNVPISEIVASPSGNIMFQKMLSKENAMGVSRTYWRKIGESEEPLEGHSTCFGKPDFVLGTIQKGKKGKFTITAQISPDIEEMLEDEREELRRESDMREKEAVKIDIGGGMVIARQDCWMEPGKRIRFAGINRDALFFAYEPDKPIKTPDGKYVYIGTTQIGKSSLSKQTSNMPIQFVSPLVYDDVVLWTENKTLIQYFMENKLQGLNFALGETFTNGTIKNLQKSESPLVIGGIALNPDGECIKIENIPDSVKTAATEYFSSRKNDTNVIEFQVPGMD